MAAVNPGIFKAYDIRGLYPTELNEDVAAPGGPGVRRLPRREAHRRLARHARCPRPRWPRPSSTARATQGADVVDYGMLGTDMLYFAVCRDGLDGGAQITASHNPKDYNGMKLVRREAFPLSGDAGISDMRDMIAADAIPAPAGPEGLAVDGGRPRRLRRQMLSFIDPARRQAVQRGARRRQRDGRARRAEAVRRGSPAGPPGCASTIDGTFPNHEANPLIEENRRDITERVIADRADIGIAWDGDADRCFFIDGGGEFVAGDFVTALLAEAFLHQVAGREDRLRRARQLRGEGHRGEVRRRRADEPRRPRVLQEADARGERGVRRRGHGPLLLPRLLLRGQRVHPGAAAAGADVEEAPDAGAAARAAAREVLHLGRDQHQGRHHGAGRGQARRRSPTATPTATSTGWTGCRSSIPTGTSTCAPSNTEPLLRLNLEATTAGLMAAKRDEVVGFIRS